MGYGAIRFSAIVSDSIADQITTHEVQIG